MDLFAIPTPQARSSPAAESGLPIPAAESAPLMTAQLKPERTTLRLTVGETIRNR
jgi:hypothetical protein